MNTTIQNDTGTKDPFRSFPEVQHNIKNVHQDLIPLPEALEIQASNLSSDGDTDVDSDLDSLEYNFTEDPSKYDDFSLLDYSFDQETFQLEATQQQNAATILQTHTRRRAAQRKTDQIRRNKNETARIKDIKQKQLLEQHAACTLQSKIRMHNSNKKTKALRQQYHRQDLEQKQHQAASVLQKRIRGNQSKQQRNRRHQYQQRRQIEQNKQKQIKKIQSLYRTKQSQRTVCILRKERARKERIDQQHIAATRIQSCGRRLLGKQKYRILKSENNRIKIRKDKNNAVIQLQRVGRGRLNRKKVQQQQQWRHHQQQQKQQQKQQQLQAQQQEQQEQQEQEQEQQEQEQQQQQQQQQQQLQEEEHIDLETTRRDALRNQWKRDTQKDMDLPETLSNLSPLKEEQTSVPIGEIKEEVCLERSSFETPETPRKTTTLHDDFSTPFSHLSPSESIDIFMELTAERNSKQTLLTDLIQKERNVTTTLNKVSRSIHQKKRKLKVINSQIAKEPENIVTKLETKINKSMKQINHLQHKHVFMKKQMQLRINEEKEKVRLKTKEFNQLMASLEIKKCDEEDMNSLLM